MKKTRILALPAIAAASLLALTGCFQLPPVGGNGGNGGDGGNGGNGGTTQEPGNGGTETGEDLAGTTWTGEMGPGSGFAELTFTLNPDGTVDISEWNGGEGFDSAADTWTGDSSNLSVTITQLQDQNSDSGAFDITFTGTAADGQMNLVGRGPDGEWQLTATQG